MATCLLWSVAQALYAEERELKTDTKEHLDVVLVVDASGSMLLTDPKRLRDEGAKLFIEFLKPGDRLAIVQFSKDASTVRPLTEFKREDIEPIKQQISGIDSTGTYTDIASGLKAAKGILDANPNQNANQAVVLISDGKMEPDPATGAAPALTNDLFSTVLPELKGKSIKVYTLCFSEQADKQFLGQISNATEATTWYGVDTEKIHEAYAELFLSAKKPQILAMSGKGFKIDPEITEATFYINREGSENIALLTPTGREVTPADKEENIHWYHTQKFDVVTLTQPEVGQWQVQGLPRNDGFATVLTNLKLVTDWPASINATIPVTLQARLYESEKPVTLPQMSGVTKFAFRITPTDKVSEPIIKEFLVDDGTHGDKIAHDGIFSLQVILDEPGEYRLRVVAQSPTFERTQQISFRVKPALISLSLATVEREDPLESFGNSEHESEDKKGDAHGEAKPGEGKEAEKPTPGSDKKPKKKHSSARDYFRVELSEEASQLKRIQLTLTAVDEKRTIIKLPLVQSHDNSLHYEVAARYLPHDGKYELLATLSGEGKGKKEIKSTSMPLRYEKHSQVVDEAGPEVLEVEMEHPKVEEPPKFPWLEMLLQLAFHGGLAALLLKMYNKAKTTDVAPVPDFVMPKVVVEGTAALEAMISLTEIDPTDSMFDIEISEAAVAAANAAAAQASSAEAASPATEEAAAGGAPAPEAGESTPAEEVEAPKEESGEGT